MGTVKGVVRPPSHVAYYVALVGILSLLLMLCCYFCIYFINKVKELSHESPTQTPCTPRPKPIAAAYPIQPEVRDSATAMAKLCKQLPAQPSGKGDTVFPTSSSPEATQTDTGGTDTVPDKVPASAAVNVVEACEVR